MKVALYARVSKAEDQTPENQLMQLQAWAQASSATIEGTYSESVSSRETRPVKEALLKKLRLGEIDAVAFVSLSRWGRSLSELAREMNEAMERGWTLISLKEGLRFDTAAGKAFGGMLAVFAEFERDLVHERTMAGLARAKAQGKKLGPKFGNQNARKRTPPGNPGPVYSIGPKPETNGRLFEAQTPGEPARVMEREKDNPDSILEVAAGGKA